LVITIGLGTITYNPNCTAIILAAGAAKAGVVAEAIQLPTTVLAPATALHQLPHARFYLTMGATDFLHERRLALLAKNRDNLSEQQITKILVDCCKKYHKKVIDLTTDDPAQRSFRQRAPAPYQRKHFRPA